MCQFRYNYSTNILKCQGTAKSHLCLGGFRVVRLLLSAILGMRGSFEAPPRKVLRAVGQPKEELLFDVSGIKIPFIDTVILDGRFHGFGTVLLFLDLVQIPVIFAVTGHHFVSLAPVLLCRTIVMVDCRGTSVGSGRGIGLTVRRCRSFGRSLRRCRFRIWLRRCRRSSTESAGNKKGAPSPLLTASWIGALSFGRGRLLFYLIPMSLITSAAMISPTTAGTKAVLPGVDRRAPAGASSAGAGVRGGSVE